MTHNLDLSIAINDDGFCDLIIAEPESGLAQKLNFPLEFDEHPVFDAMIGAEIYSWLSLWAKA